MEAQNKPSLEEIALISQYVDENILQQTEEDTSQFKEKITALIEYSKAFIKMEISSFEKRLQKENEKFNNYYSPNELYAIKEKLKYIIEFQLMEALVRKINIEYLLMTKLIHGTFDVKKFDKRTQNTINKYPDYYDYFLKRKYTEEYNIPYAILQYTQNPKTNTGIYELNNEALARFVDEYLNGILCLLFILKNNNLYPFIYMKDYFESEFYINNEYDGWAFSNYLFNRNKYENRIAAGVKPRTVQNINDSIKAMTKKSAREIEKDKAEIFLIAYDYLNTFRPKPSIPLAIEKAKSFFEEPALYRLRDLTQAFEQMIEEKEDFAEYLIDTIDGEFTIGYNYSFPEITRNMGRMKPHFGRIK